MVLVGLGTVTIIGFVTHTFTGLLKEQISGLAESQRFVKYAYGLYAAFAIATEGGFL